MLTKDLAICIRAVDFSETSQVVTFFARDTGKISAIAKGSKRPKSPFDGPIEVFAFGEIVFSDTTRDKLATLTEFQQQPGLTHLAKDLFALHCCLFAAELLNSMTDDYDPHPQLFESFLQFLKNTQVTSHESRGTISLLILFQLALLKEVGLMPVLDYCVNCKTRYEQRAEPAPSGVEGSGEVYFSSSANGLVCKDCEPTFPDKVRLSKEAAACLANFRQIPDAAEETLREIEKILIRHFTDLLGRPPKMAKHVLGG